ncbi:MAG: ATP-binding protein [Cyclobacteriaceae bacterium]
MDDIEGGVLLIGATMIILPAFAVTVLAVMLIYRKRRLQHLSEIGLMNKKFHTDLLQTRLDVQQRTLEYIGNEIHDFVGNRLSLALIYTQSIPEDQGDVRDQIENVIHEALATVKSLSKLKLESVDGDLEDLIRNEVDKLRVIGHLTIRFESSLEGLKCSSAVINYFVLRILQEFLHNSITHSSCSQINMHLKEYQDCVELYAEDDGIGFLLNEKRNDLRKGIGLNTMKKRAELINARFELVSAPGRGTSMRLSIPEKQLKV